MSEARPIDFYYWPTVNGWKVAIMLEECGLPYTVRLVNLLEGEQRRPEFLAISPNGRMPAIVDPDGPDGAALAIFESAAILAYLGDKTGRFLPQDGAGRWDVLQWLVWQAANLGPVAGNCAYFRHYAPERSELAVARFEAEIGRLYGVLDQRLADREHICGDYSIADMAAWPWVTAYRGQGVELARFANVARWFRAVGTRPAVRTGKALAEDLRASVGQARQAVQRDQP